MPGRDERSLVRRPRRGRPVVTMLAGAAVLLGAWALRIGAAPGDAAKPPRKPAYPSHLAAGPGQWIAQRSCLMCHSAMLITQQHKDSTGWEKTVATMEKWGVKLTPEERDTLVTYLRKHQGVRIANK